LLPLLLLPPPPCCPDVASAALPPLPDGDISRDLAAALLVLPRLFVVAGVTLGHVFSPKPDRAILKEFRSLIVTNLLSITTEQIKQQAKRTEIKATDLDTIKNSCLLDAIHLAWNNAFSNS
jgi:hypothetical protein